MVSAQRLQDFLIQKCNRCGYIMISDYIFNCPECNSFNITLLSLNDFKTNLIKIGIDVEFRWKNQFSSGIITK